MGEAQAGYVSRSQFVDVGIDDLESSQSTWTRSENTSTPSSLEDTGAKEVVQDTSHPTSSVFEESSMTRTCTSSPPLPLSTYEADRSLLDSVHSFAKVGTGFNAASYEWILSVLSPHSRLQY